MGLNDKTNCSMANSIQILSFRFFQNEYTEEDAI